MKEREKGNGKGGRVSEVKWERGKEKERLVRKEDK